MKTKINPLKFFHQIFVFITAMLNLNKLNDLLFFVMKLLWNRNNVFESFSKLMFNYVIPLITSSTLKSAKSLPFWTGGRMI